MKTKKTAADQRPANAGLLSLKTRYYGEIVLFLCLVSLGYWGALTFGTVPHVSSRIPVWFLSYQNFGLTQAQCLTWAGFTMYALLLVLTLGLAGDVILRDSIARDLPSVLVTSSGYSTGKLAFCALASFMLGFSSLGMSAADRDILDFPLGVLQHALSFTAVPYIFSRVAMLLLWAAIVRFRHPPASANS